MRTRPLSGAGRLLMLAAAGVALTSCSPARYLRSADRETYAIVQDKTAAVPGMTQEFTIEPPAPGFQIGCSDTQTVCSAVFGDNQPPVSTEDEGAISLSLEQALAIAAMNSRDYQRQKETLYESALNLTLQRHAFAPQFNGSIGGDYQNTDTGSDEEVGLDGSLGLSWLFKTGTAVTATLSTALSRFLTGDPREAASSAFNLTITQPLLAGAGIAVYENLTQAERNVIYDMRTFVRYRRSFFVSVLSDYYNVVRQRKVLENERFNYDSLVVSRERAELLGKAGRLPEFQVDQTRQDELSAADRVDDAVQSYEGALDRFKLTLGLPADAKIALDPAELDRLSSEMDTEMPLTLESAVAVALANRLDLATARDEVEDSERQVEIAKNDLLPGLDLSGQLGVGTEDNQPLQFKPEGADWSVGFELDLPLDRKSERNTYRRQLIELDQAKRSHCGLRDEVVLDVRDAWRNLTRAQRSYEIQQESLRLAQRRVESTMMLLDAGRASTRDMLDARSALLSAQNSLARAMVDYKVARLALARDLDILGVGADGKLQESFHEYSSI